MISDFFIFYPMFATDNPARDVAVASCSLTWFTLQLRISPPAEYDGRDDCIASAEITPEAEQVVALTVKSHIRYGNALTEFKSSHGS